MSAVMTLTCRGDVGKLLDGEQLGIRLHRLHNASGTLDTHEKDKVKTKHRKKGKIKTKDKSKVKRDKSPEKPERSTPEIHLHGNPSSFAIYTSIRQTVLEDQMKQISQIYLQACQTRSTESDSDDDGPDKSHDSQLRLPKIVSIGLCSVVDLIRETQLTHPTLCGRALQSLLDILQGQQPEGLRTEPTEVVDSLYHLLMDLSQSRVSCSPEILESETLAALACSCLLSLVVARGDTGKLLTAVAAMLMFSSKLATQAIKLPYILTSLQKSIQAVLIGKTTAPDWLTHGIRDKCKMMSVMLTDLQALWPSHGDVNAYTSLASDGRFIYVFSCHGLVKIGSGYSNTVKGHIYGSNPSFKCKEQGWLAIVKGKLFYKTSSDLQGALTLINMETLQPSDKMNLDTKSYGPNVMFSDGEHVGHIASFREDSFVVRTFDPFHSPITIVSELTLKLARKCLEVFGSASFDAQEDIHCINSGIEDDALSVMAGRDFALLRTTNSKIFYMGKSQSLGMRPAVSASGGANAPASPNSATTKWTELPIIKSPKIVQYSVGHEGSHGLLVAEDGSVFFVGTARRGEDGDAGSLSKARRQVKPVKPKKMIRLEGKTIVSSACNSGTSALVTRDGEVYMFGKDAVNCEQSTGLLSDVKGLGVTSVSLGKAHGVLLTNKGHVYTFGLNNKGQCGRDFVSSGAAKELSVAITMADDEDEGDDEGICPPGKHRWEINQCMICTVCGECTGYSNACINSGRPDRAPGQPCGCGTGESGCAECGCCKACAGERGGGRGVGNDQVYNGRLMDALQRVQEPMPFDLFIGRHRARLEGKRGQARFKRMSSRLKAAIAEIPGGSGGGGGGSDYEQDPLKVASVPPGHLEIGPSDSTALQVACGLHHTVILLNNGDVYTFGSNQYGQLGLNDTVIRGVPTRVSLRSSVTVKQVAAGSNHTVLLTANGQVYTFGNHKKGQLGRPIEDEEQRGSGAAKDSKSSAFVPGAVPGIGAKHGRRATWIGASGDQTFLRIDESLINVHTLSRSNIVANPSCIVLIPMVDIGRSNIKCLVISRLDGSCRSFNSPDQVNLIDHSVCLDPVNDVLWSLNPVTMELDCYNVVFSEMKCTKDSPLSQSNILSPELAIPVCTGNLCSRSHCAINMLDDVHALIHTSSSDVVDTVSQMCLTTSCSWLVSNWLLQKNVEITARVPVDPHSCLDVLTLAHQLNMTVSEEMSEKHTTSTAFSKDDFSVVNRFESHGGGWGYSGHSIEAIRFMCDTDVLIGGFGLFGGRGEYFGKIKLFEIGPDAGDNETEGELLAETEEMPYRCGAREKYALLFDEPVPVQANCWYVAWARISGPSSDCGSSGQTTVTTEDQVVFRFRNSKKSNNGTDANAGQIPQLLYRLPSPDVGQGSSGTGIRKCDQMEQVHILSPEFSLTVSPECFESLISLLSWSWSTFCSLGCDVQQMKGMNLKSALLDLRQLVYISAVSLRLIRTYICEIYPWQATKTKVPSETTRLAECVGEVRLLLRQILSESNRYQAAAAVAREGRPSSSSDGSKFETLREMILEECHRTFTQCFHAFYPTGNLKWICLCELLTTVDLSRDGASSNGRLLAAVLEALCHPAIKLTAIMPINGEHNTEQQVRQQVPGADDNTQCSLLLSETLNFPMLVGHMMHRTEMELVGRGHWTFKDMLDRLLYIAGLPLRQAINQEKILAQSSLVYNACCLLVALVSELSASATGTEVTVTLSSRPMLSTPNRFTRTSTGTYWNTGNGSPDAVCFTVSRPGIVIAGVGLFGGGGTYEYELELLDDSERSNDSSPNGRWNSLDVIKGTYGPDDCVNDVAEIKFSKPIPIKENVNYAIRLRNRGNRTKNGDSGLSRVKCPDGTVFMFSACSLSSNGTNHSRGQIPQILYYSSPQEGEGATENSRSLAESQSRRNAIGIVTTIFRAATELLQRMQTTKDEKIFSMVNNCPMFSTLLPMVAGYVRPVATSDPWGAVQILSLIQEILPATASLIRSHLPLGHNPAGASHAPVDGAVTSEYSNGISSPANHRHYAIIESDHPYKPATVSNYKVTFPSNVHWMVLEFDPQSGTAQVEDYLQLFIPAKANAYPMPGANQHPEPEPEGSTVPTNWWPVFRKFHGTDNWPLMAMILPGNEVCFSLETASDYIKDEKAYTYGFKCTVIGHEWQASTNEGLIHLEKELAGLGGICAASLMRKDMLLPIGPAENSEEDLNLLEANAQQVFSAHPTLLSKGFSMFHMPTVTQALEGNLPFNYTSNERTFLKDFINCNPGTSGCRLASWLQPEPYLDPKKCTILYSQEELRCNWPVTITIQTKDQYGHLVKVQNLKVEAKAVPIIKDLSEERRVKRLSRYDTEGSLIFGGLPPPRLDIPYQVTVKDKDLYHAISMMKAFENYSFEELRYASPAIRRPAENMLIRDNQDGMYSASWTPGGVGLYNIHVKLDNFETGEVFKVEVRDAPRGVMPPAQPQTTKRHGAQAATKMRKFITPHSAGLRVRLHPSLQSEQIGVIRPSGIISFTSEIHNNDGVWLRLSSDSIRACCSPLNGYTEGWALQYNQHLGKTLLVPVEEPRPSLEADPGNSPSRRGPDPRGSCVGAAPGTTFPCVYSTVKCGLSGHNIRVVPDLDSPAIGMVILGNQLTAINETITGDGTWVQLDKISMQSYCHETEGDAWCLVRTASGDVYLTPDLETDSPAGASSAPFSVTKQPRPQQPMQMLGSKGFDFTTAAKVPMFPAFATGQPEFSGRGNQMVAMSSPRSSTSLSPFSLHSRDPDIEASPKSAEQEADVASPLGHWAASASLEHPALSEHVSVPDPLGKARSASLRREELPFCSLPASHKSAPGGGASRESTPVGRKESQQHRIHLQFPDLPPELQGVSVKDLVKALGESRVNGNGVTPPRTPPGTPKKTLSRSSSPKAPVSTVHDTSTTNLGSNLLSRKENIISLQPHGFNSVGSPGKIGGGPVLSSPATLQPSLNAATSPAIRKVLSPPVAKRIFMPSSEGEVGTVELKTTGKSYLRSYSSSPQRRNIVALTDGSGRSLSTSPVRCEPAENEGLDTLEITQKHFLVGPFQSKDDIRLGCSQKFSRKDRSRTLRSKRERAASPSAKEKPTSSGQSRSTSSPKVKAQEPAHEAMAPSVSHCIRAVFAAFLWHEGIVHDAMACASFLKFHPNLGKDVHKKRQDNTASAAQTSSESPVGKADELRAQKNKRLPASDKEIGNLNEARKVATKTSPHKARLSCHIPSSKVAELQTTSGTSSATDPPAVLPTLCHLISFWEELSSTTLKVVEQNLIIPTPLLTLKPPVEAEKDDKEKNTKGKSKKSKENKHAIPAVRGNLFGEAAGGPLLGGAIGGDKDTMCELCNLVFPHPVTYHMRQAHPGCGKPAGGQGYNSGGNFCGGWAGNCGDGGMGGSTWYLMCDTCRSKYLRDRIQVPKDRSKKTKKKSALMKQSSYLQAMDPHLVMKNNAMFILDLASACSIHLPPQAPNSYSKAVVGSGSAGQLPMLNEDMISDHCTFPVVPFSYLEQCGARAADSAFNEDAVFAGEVPRHGFKMRNFEHSVSQGNEIVKDRIRPNSIYVLENSRLNDAERAMLEESWNLQLQGRLSDDEEQTPNRMQKAFQRSISELGSGVLSNASLVQQPIGLHGEASGQEGESVSAGAAANGRRRNNSSCMGYDSGMSLLKHPSAAMSRLTQSSDKSQNDKGGGLSVESLPVMKFCVQRHDLESLQCCMKLALCKASCRTYALQAFNWLVRHVTQLECLHDLFWHFVSSLSSSPMDEDEEEPVVARRDKRDPDPEKGLVLCEHPLSDITIAGEAVAPLIQAFHAFLQTISDVMMYLPAGSSLQQMAVRCWCLKFQLSDHVFLHRSHVFSNISKILSKSEEGWDPSSSSAGLQMVTRRKHLKDLTAAADVKASSRQAMIASITDNSTETFWESGDEDKNKSKTITITCAADHRPKVVYVHIDNARDLGNKVSTVAFSAGNNAEDLASIRQLDLELRFAGWVNAWLPERNSKVIRLELKGPDNSLRLRQIKVLGETEADGRASPDEQRQQSAVAVQQKNCELETLKVFRLLTSQVFGRLINEGSNAEVDEQEKAVAAEGGQAHGDVNLKEHMVSILFSRSKLTQLQKLVCTHIVQAIRKETIRVQEQWEDELTDGVAGQKGGSSSDAYCFELLSLVLALSGSTVGRHYLAQQHSLLEDLLSLLHTASPRVQRQVVALIRRVLLDVQPKVLAGILGVLCLPPSDFSILSSNSDFQYDPNRKGLLDVFLACIAKALMVQVKSKLPSGAKSKNSVETFRLADCFVANSVLPGRWWFRGTISIQLAETIISLLKDLSAGKLTKEWAAVTKSAIAEPILNLSHLVESLRNPTDCLKTPTLWLTMAALCVLSDDHADQLSSGQWVGKGEAAQARPTCENHDDGETLAMILCNECGNLCSDCDRILHLHRKARSHQRQVFKEEEEAIKVDLHEGCGRIKLYWLLALADSKTLKAVVEFRNASKDKLRGGNESVLGVGSLEPCRFCGTMTHPGLMTVGTVCTHPECQEHAKNACTKTLPCGHACGGIRDEDPCLFCLHGCSSAQDTLKQDADDMCMICFTEALSGAPAVQLACGHVFHWHCCRQVLQRLWPGPRITFGFSRCPICKADIGHSVLEDLLQPIRSRQEDVRRKALMRLEYEGLHKADAITTAGMSFHNDPAGYAMDRYAYYVCFKCKKAYYGGEVRCEEQAAGPDDYDPSELVCGACSDVSRAQMCSRHGADFLEYKCRYCCSVAIFFCFGTTHFCNACHEDFQRVTTIPKGELPHCPAGPKAKQLEGEECPLHVVHPPTGEEFALGCGICRNAHTF